MNFFNFCGNLTYESATSATCCCMLFLQHKTVVDPDLQIRWGGGGGHPDSEIEGYLGLPPLDGISCDSDEGLHLPPFVFAIMSSSSILQAVDPGRNSFR